MPHDTNITLISAKSQQESKVENKREEDSDVQFLMERRSEILREINEDTGEEKVEDSEVRRMFCYYSLTILL